MLLNAEENMILEAKKVAVRVRAPRLSQSLKHSASRPSLTTDDCIGSDNFMNEMAKYHIEAL